MDDSVKKNIDEMLARSLLDKVLSDPVFSSSPRQKQLLMYLAESSLSGKTSIKGYTIGIDVYERGADFDPANDAIVRVEASRLRAKLRDYYLGNGARDKIRMELPKGSYKLIFVNADEASATIVSQHQLTSDWLESKPTIAVLPFLNVSDAPEKTYLVEGITDSIIFALSKLSGIFILSRSTTSATDQINKDTVTAAKELGVRYLLQGKVQSVKTKLRIIVTLTDSLKNETVFVDRFENSISAIFELQDSITKTIIDNLHIKLAPDEAKYFGQEKTDNFDAYDALLQGLSEHWKYTPTSINKARSFFQKAVVLDPTYASAHAWLARSMLHQWIMRWDDSPGLRERAVDHAEKAIQLDPNLPYANAIRGWVHLWCCERESSISFCRRAVGLDPNNPEMLNFLSMALSSAGMGNEALYYIEKAFQYNPKSSPFYQFVLAQAHFVLEDYDKAIMNLKRGVELGAGFIPNHIYLCLIFALLGMEEDLQACYQHTMSLLGGDKSRLIWSPWTNKELKEHYENLLVLAGFR